MDKKYPVLLVILIAVSGCTQVDLNENLNDIFNPSEPAKELSAEPVYDSTQQFASGEEIKINAVQNADKIIEMTQRVADEKYRNADFYPVLTNDLETKEFLFDQAQIFYGPRSNEQLWIPGTEKNYIMKVPMVEPGANWTVEDGLVIVHAKNYQENCDVNFENCEFGFVDVDLYPTSIVYIVDENGIYNFGGYA